MIKRLLNFVNKNGIVSSLVASIIFAIVVLFISRDKSVLTYEVVENQKLFESTNNEALIILNKDSQEIKQDIYYVEIDIWNQGKKEIEKADLKEMFTISFEDSIKVLGNFKIEETHPEVTQSIIEVDSTKEKINIQFQYLEKGNGIKLIGYYSSNNEDASKLNHQGYISKGGEIKCYNKSFSQEYSVAMIIIFLIISGAFAWYSAKYVGKFISDIIDKYIDKDKHWKWNLAAYIVVMIPIFYFVLFKFINKIPGWIKDFLENYFNPESPFNL